MIVDLEERVEDVEAASTRLIAHQAWETSFLRRGMIAGITYACGVVLLTLVGHLEAWRDAFVPLIGYIITTLSLSPLKEIWVEQKVENMKDKAKEGAKRHG